MSKGYDRIQAIALGIGLTALLVAGFYGGMPNDRALVDARFTGFMDLAAGPMAAVLALAALVAAFRPMQLRATLPVVSTALFVLWAALTGIHSLALSSTVSTFGILLTGAALAGALTMSAAQSRRLCAAAFGVATIGAMVAGFAISQYIPEFVKGNSSWRVFANFVNPNFLAGFMVMVLPVSIALFLGSKQPPLTMLAAFAAAIQGVCMLLTGSRLGFAAIIVALATFAILIWRGGAVAGPARERTLLLAGILGLAVLAGARPVIRRLGRAGAEAYSLQFRVYTWRGAAAMAAANPLIGVGLGGFNASYGRYAQVGYTAHAHSSYLQIADETGAPGLALFLVMLSAAVLPMVRAAAQKSAESTGGQDDPAALPLDARILCAGVVAGLVGALLRNMVDSELYSPACAAMFGALVGVGLATARMVQPLTGSRGRIYLFSPIARLPAATALCGAALFAGMIIGGRMHALSAEVALMAGNLERGQAEYRAAAGDDPRNPDYHLKLANMQPGSVTMESEFKAAIAASPIGKCYYQYGMALLRLGRAPEGISRLEQALQVEPHNLQALVALDRAYRQVGRGDRADAACRTIVAMYYQPFGRIRAIPEVVEWRYAVGFIGLGDSDTFDHRASQAADEYARGCAILQQFWAKRDDPMQKLESGPGTLTEAAGLYNRGLTGYALALTALGRTGDAATARKTADTVNSQLSVEQQNGQPAMQN